MIRHRRKLPPLVEFQLRNKQEGVNLYFNLTKGSVHSMEEF